MESVDTIISEQALKRLEELRAALPPKGRVLIIPHDYPDPDALASAAAAHLLLDKYFGLHSQIVFTGVVSRAENREMLRHFHYKWQLLSQLRTVRRRVPCLFVDTKPHAGNVTMPSFGKPVAVFDHHPVSRKNPLGDIFADVRAGAGASVTILHEYLVAAGIPVPKWLAAVMAYGIATETLDLSRNCTPEDMQAYTALLSRANMSILGEIRHASLPPTYYAHLKEAISNAWVFGRVAWTHLRAVEQPEIVAEVADLLARMERNKWSFCTAWQGDNLLVSLRSSQKGARCGQLLRKVIRKQGSGGGHHWMAAGSLNMEGLQDAEREVRKDAFVKTLVSKIERRAVAGEQPLELMARPLVEPGLL